MPSKLADELETTSDEIEAALVKRHGPVLSNRALCEALQFPSMSAFQKALARGSVPVKTFTVDGRRGRFALSKDVARWWVSQWAAANPKGGDS